MARKAKPPPKSRTPRQKSHLPLDDDFRWRPLEAEHKRLVELYGSSSLAALELTKALASGKLRCMWRRLASGWIRELTPITFWADHRLSDWSGVFVIVRELAHSFTPEHNIKLFVWKPDLDALWPSMATDAPKPEPQIDERRKPGPRINKDWKLHLAGELHRVVIVEKKQPPTADELAKYCHEKTGYLPEISEVSRLIRLLR